MALSEEVSRREAEMLAVRELQDAGQLDRAGRPILVEPARKPDVGDWPVMPGAQLPMENLKIINLVVAEEWPKQLTLRRVKLIPPQAEWTRVAFLSALQNPDPHGFAFSLELGEGNPVARLELEGFAWPGPTGGREAVLAFHQAMTKGAGFQPDDLQQCLHIPVMIAPESSGVIDWKGMESIVRNGCHNLPTWLRLLWPRLNCLQRLQQVGACFAPIVPVPNPLRLEAVLGSDWGIETFEALQRVGQLILQLLFPSWVFLSTPLTMLASSPGTSGRHSVMTALRHCVHILASWKRY